MTVTQETNSPPVAALSVEAVTKTFQGVQALRGVSLTVQPGQIVGLIGPNGAGKTTLFNCISGFIRPDSGVVRIEGVRLDGLKPHRIAQLGVVRTFQSIRMFPGFTVFESLLAAQHSRHRAGPIAAIAGLPRHRREMRAMSLEARRIASLLRLEHVLHERVERLGLLDQRRLEVGRAIAARPHVLLLDEPSAGATATEAEELRTVVAGLRAEGKAVLLIEHNIPFVMGLADQLVVLNFGELVMAGDAATVRDNKVVQEIYLGTL